MVTVDTDHLIPRSCGVLASIAASVVFGAIGGLEIRKAHNLERKGKQQQDKPWPFGGLVEKRITN